MKLFSKKIFNTAFFIRAGVAALVSFLVSAVVVMIIYGKFAFFPFLIGGGVLTAIVSVFLILHCLISLTRNELRALLTTLLSGTAVSMIVALIVYSIVKSGFNVTKMNWVDIFSRFLIDGLYWLFVGLGLIGFLVLYYFFISRDELRWAFFRRGIRGKGELSQIESNLENSRWLTDKERDKIFTSCGYGDLATLNKDGVPVRAAYNDGKLAITLNSPCHSLIIGSTGSGKTTTFINPMIQILAASGAGSSMLITDPKGELFSIHSKFLKERGYDVRVLDLRDAYHSYRWNPLEPLWDTYREYAEVEKNAYERTDNVAKSGLKITAPISEYGKEWYEFNGKAFAQIDKLVNEMKIFRAQKLDEVYEDMSDLVSVLIPIQNQNDPMWEKGARTITMAVLLAMLEDSEVPEIGMTKEKFNLFNMAKILQRSDDDYKDLKRYFEGRHPLSKALANSRQVLSAAEKTRSSYMSVLQEKLSIFNDSGICALTSTSDFKIEDLALRPTAFFVKIPDEKDTRHGLASIFMTNVYKSLIKISSTRADLSLPRNVYYILDEFGNMPKIEKFDKMITVGRSRKIWFNMVVQSYSQLNNVYGDTVADIVKGNCGIKMFIGSNDMSTCKEFSELCGNITVVTQGSSLSGKDNTTYSQSMQTRPLIYPSELQKLNNKTSTGNSIVVTFGNYPLKTSFTPSYKVNIYKTGAMSIDDVEGRLFDEAAVYYDISVRNKYIFGEEVK